MAAMLACCVQFARLQSSGLLFCNKHFLAFKGMYTFFFFHYYHIGHIHSFYCLLFKSDILV